MKLPDYNEHSDLKKLCEEMGLNYESYECRKKALERLEDEIWTAFIETAFKIARVTGLKGKKKQ